VLHSLQAEDHAMGAEAPKPDDLMRQVAALRLPQKTDQRLQHLMDRNNNGQLGPSEKDELESLVEVSETISLLRAQALRILGWKA
jgi:hypothetical protein